MTKVAIRTLTFIMMIVGVATQIQAYKEPHLGYKPKSGIVLVSNLNHQDIDLLISQQSRVNLQFANRDLPTGILLTVKKSTEGLIIQPYMPLLDGEYSLNLSLSNNNQWEKQFIVSSPSKQPKNAPDVIGISPANAVIPANTLRLYLHFSEPMQSGQARTMIYLVKPNGTPDNLAFLPTPIELWDASQTRLTLLLDPGRVKQDVGPNLALGAPLQENQQYQLVVARGMKAATGKTTSANHYISLNVVAAERRRFIMKDWIIDVPDVNSKTPIKVHFDRVIDPSNTLRNLHIESLQGTKIVGNSQVIDRSWIFTPSEYWKSGDFRLVAAGSLEDIAGNRLSTAFDSVAGTAKSDPEFGVRLITIPAALQNANKL